MTPRPPLHRPRRFGCALAPAVRADGRHVCDVVQRAAPGVDVAVWRKTQLGQRDDSAIKEAGLDRISRILTGRSSP